MPAFSLQGSGGRTTNLAPSFTEAHMSQAPGPPWLAEALLLGSRSPLITCIVTPFSRLPLPLCKRVERRFWASALLGRGGTLCPCACTTDNTVTVLSWGGGGYCPTSLALPSFLKHRKRHSPLPCPLTSRALYKLPLGQWRRSRLTCPCPPLAQWMSDRCWGQ